MRVRLTKCHACGGMKQLPSQTAYVYCDFCGALADWDFNTACSAGNALPGPAYEALARQLAPALSHAKTYRDAATPEGPLHPALHAAHRALSVVLLAAHPEPRVPHALPRLLLGHDDRAGPGPASSPALDAARPAHRRAPAGTLPRFGGRPKYPDPISSELLERIGVSAFVQGWLSWISPAMQQYLLDDARLRDQYVEITPPALLLRRCGRCGTRVDAVTGAWSVICFTCGEKIDAKHPEVNCPSCGAPSSLLSGSDAHVCPYCGVRAERVRGALG